VTDDGRGRISFPTPIGGGGIESPSPIDGVEADCNTPEIQLATLHRDLIF